MTISLGRCRARLLRRAARFEFTVELSGQRPSISFVSKERTE